MAGKITLNLAFQHAAELFAAVSQMQSQADKLEYLKARFWEMRQKDGGAYTTMGALLGITAAEAEELYTVLDQANTALASAFIQQLCARLG